mgnify:CR=1 FL=1|tara:strand:+ start:777 stop:1475 length:699 start_codon:yes stop_codon:yes gene_type:complete
MKKVVGYIRTSTTRQGVSIRKQKDAIKEYCRKNDLELVETIKEEGVSGNKLNREGFDKVMNMVLGNAIDGVITYWVSRAGRRASETINLINQCLEKEITLISIKEGIDTSNMGGRMQAKMMAVWAEEELIQMKERIKDAIRYKKSNGLKYNGTPAYGTYEKNGVLYEDDFEMKIVRNIKNLKSRGWSWYKIAKKLTEEDIPTKMKTGNGWHINQVKQVYKFHYESETPVLVR